MTREIKKTHPHTKFIYISCYEDFNYLQTAMKNDVLSYLLKPIDEEELAEAVRRAVSVIETEHKQIHMQNVMNENMGIFRENLLYNLLFSKYVDVERLQETFSNLGLESHGQFLIAKFELITVTEHSQNTLLSVDELRKLFVSRFSCISVAESEHGWIVLFSFGSNPDAEFRNAVKAELIAYRNVILTQYHQTVNIGLSLAGDSLYQVQSMLDQTVCALENHMVYDGSIYLFEALPHKEMTWDDLVIKKEVEHLIENASEKELTDFFERVYPENVYLTQSYIKTMCVSIITTLQLSLSDRKLGLSNIFEDSNLVLNKLENPDTIQNIRQWLFNILKSVITFINTTEKSHFDKIVSDITAYIDKNYATITTLDSAVANFHISTSYARYIFKMHTGQTIFDYLLMRRMEAAKLLLKNPYIKVYDVAEQVGYTSKAHFSKQFKGYTGLTPKEYQQNLRKSENNTDTK